MMITLELDTVDLAQIAESGQCFRMAPLEDGRWLVPMGRWMATARQRDARRIELSADGEDGTFLDAARRYFDADTDYLTAIRAIDPSDAYLSAAAEAGRGIRILRQPLFETLISFIVSQNNNIPRIRTIIAKLCGGADKPFPKPKQLAAWTEDELRAIGLGYRAPYVHGAAERFDESEEARLLKMDYETAKASLMAYHGVGPKVADCVCLFALGHKEAFPQDVWVKRILARHYPNGFAQMDSPFAGVYQQYMFAYERDRG